MTEPRLPLQLNAQFVRLWTMGSRRVYAYIMTFVANRTDAEDILQDVGVTAWQKFAEFNPALDFVAWCCGIAHFKVLAYLRASRRHASMTEALLEDLRTEMASMSDILDRQHQAIQDCLSLLPAQDRVLIGLRYQPDTTVEQISAQTGRTVAAVYKALQRIHERLFDCASRKLMAEGRV